MFTRFEQDYVDPQYIANMATATNYFQSWFSGRHAASFNTMLVSMHRLACRGGYAGYTSSDGPQAAVTSQFRGVDKNAWRPLLKKEWFTDVVVQDGYVHPVLKAAKVSDSHYLIERSGGYELYLPHTSLIPVFLEEMAAAMTTLSQGFCARVLANYIQYFVIGHPFEKINFSICMAQANVILRLHGYKPIYHEYLDFNCFVYDYDRIEQIFASKIKAVTL